MVGLRKAALCLHGLSKHDRTWLLKKLPEQSRSQLNELLTELEDLGIPSTNGLKTLGVNNVSEKSQLAADTADEYELNTISADIVWKALAGEPSSVIAAILACRNWSWSDEVKLLYSKLQRSALKIPTDINERVKQSLIKALLTRVQDADGSVTFNLQVVKANENNIFRRMGGSLWRR